MQEHVKISTMLLKQCLFLTEAYLKGCWIRTNTNSFEDYLIYLIESLNDSNLHFFLFLFYPTYEFLLRHPLYYNRHERVIRTTNLRTLPIKNPKSIN